MRAALAWLAVVVLACLARAGTAHPGTSAVALVKVAADRRVSIVVAHDALAFALDETPRDVSDAAMEALIAGTDVDLAASLADARERFGRLLRVEADGERVPIEILASPDVAHVRAWLRDHPERPLPVKLDLEARATLPAGARELRLRFPAALGDVIATVSLPGAEPVTWPMKPGETTPAVALFATSGAPRPAMSALEVFCRYLGLGYVHIVPRGLDHVLFVLGLFLLSARWKPLLWQVSAFTLAHTISLALTMLGVVELSPHVVEPLIAASIAFVALENVFARRVSPWRPAIVFAFGLVHGMGFAGVLRELGLPRGQFASALVAFNVGVELGQLTVLAAAFALVGWWRERAWYRSRVTVPASIAIALVAIVWTVQRVA